MNSAAAIVIQVGLIFGPVIAFLVLRCILSSRTLLVFFALAFAFLTGWSASYSISELGWRPPLKHGGSVDLSPSAGFWIFGTGMLILLLALTFHKQAQVGVEQNGHPGDPGGKTGGWRVGHTGRDQMYYEEFLGGSWQRIAIDGEMLMGPAHHVIYFASPEKWENYPEWATGRRDEIIARIKSEFTPPDYEYSGG